MLRSLFSGVSGLRNNQVRMDVIGNNIANVNTVAFKAGRVTFKEGFAQLLQGASRPPGDHGGTNPIQIGSGSQIGSIDTLFTQGSVESTGNANDLAVEGDSMFVMAKGAQHFYTRSGNFQLDGAGHLVTPTNGFVVQGRMAVNGSLQGALTDIVLPVGQKVPAKFTTQTTLAGNLDSGAPDFVGNINVQIDRDLPANSKSISTTSQSVYDSLGVKHELKITMWKTGAAQWNWQVEQSDPTVTVAGAGVATFGADGKLATFTNPTATLTPANGASPIAITLKPGIGDINGVTSFGGASSAVLKDQDGYTAGQLENYSIDRTGTVTGFFTNGVTSTLAQVALSDFNNPSGLMRVGDNMYAASGNSGEPVIGYAGEGSQSAITSGALELSNVDLAQEFTNMIITQRGFQANGRVITTSDEMLQELVNLKR